MNREQYIEAIETTKKKSLWQTQLELAHKAIISMVSCFETGELDVEDLEARVSFTNKTGIEWFDAMARCGESHTIKVLLEAGFKPKGVSCCLYAIRFGHLECVKLLLEYMPANDEMFLKHAVLHDKPEILQYILSEMDDKSKFRSKVCDVAAKHGMTECMIVAATNGCPVTHVTFEKAVSYGRLDCAIVALKAGCPVTSTAAIRAIVYPEIQDIITKERGTRQVDVRYKAEFVGMHVEQVASGSVTVIGNYEQACLVAREKTQSDYNRIKKDWDGFAHYTLYEGNKKVYEYTWK